MDPNEFSGEHSGPSSISSDQASLCVISEPDDDDDGFIHLDRNSLPSSINSQDQNRTVIVFHSVDEEYFDDEDVFCQYIRPPGWREAPKDEVALFKVGWVSTGECIARLSVADNINDTNPIGVVTFSGDQLPKGTSDLYQFCYLHDSTVLGASTPFQLQSRHMSISAENCWGIKIENAEHGGLVILKTVEEQLAEELRRREGELSRLQEEFTKLSCSSEELNKVHTSTLEGIQVQLRHQTECVSQLVMDKVALETEKAELATRVTQLEELVQQLSSSQLSSEQAKSINREDPLQAPEKKTTESSESDKDLGFHDQPPEVLVRKLNKRLYEVIEEKQLFQEQLGVATMSLKQRCDELKVTQAQLSSFKGLMSERMITHKMVLAQNAHLQEELKNMKEELAECRKKCADNELLEDQLAHAQARLREMEHGEVGLEQHGIQCAENLKKIEELQSLLTSSNLIRDTLQNELETEIIVREDRDRRLEQVEHSLLEALQKAEDRSSRDPLNGDSTIAEMERNLHSTLEALEDSFKETHIARTRKATLSSANRTLCLQLKQDQELSKQKDEENKSTIAELKKKCSDEMEANQILKAELEEQQQIVNSLQNRITQLEEIISDQSCKEDEAEVQTQIALETTQTELNLLRNEKMGLLRDCSVLKKKLDEEKCSKESLQEQLNKQTILDKNCNCELNGKLLEAKEEYYKLYLEKVRLQEKYDKLQQKIRRKVSIKQRINSVVAGISDPLHPTPTRSGRSWALLGIDELM